MLINNYEGTESVVNLNALTSRQLIKFLNLEFFSKLYKYFKLDKYLSYTSPLS